MMSQYPLLRLPIPERTQPLNKKVFPQQPTGLSPERQAQRLGPRFQRLASLDDLTLCNDPSSIAPERALVLEVASRIDFQEAIRNIQGLELLGSEDFAFEPSEDFPISNMHKGKEEQWETDQLSIKGLEQQKGQWTDGRLYLSMPDISVLRQLLSLWRRWQHGEDLPRGHTRWRDIFATLRNIRPWGPSDRLSEETIACWQEETAKSNPGTMQRIEIEMWFREDRVKRFEAYRRVKRAVDQAAGNVIHHAVIEEVGYEAVLIDVPSEEITQLAKQKEVHLLVCDDIMFLRPQSFVNLPDPAKELEPEIDIPEDKPNNLPPIAALLDGVPVQNHALPCWTSEF